jgi:hypothetical protein
MGEEFSFSSLQTRISYSGKAQKRRGDLATERNGNSIETQAGAGGFRSKSFEVEMTGSCA